MMYSIATNGSRTRGMIAVALIVACIAIIAWFVVRQDAPARQIAGDVGLQLVTADGNVFDRAALRGSPSIMYFSYTRCPDKCPIILSRLVAARKKLGLAASDLTIVFVTIDPENDTPPRLKEFTDTFDGPVLAVTGTPEAIEHAADKAAVFVKRVTQPDGEVMIDHTTSAFIYDRDGDFFDAALPEDSEQEILGRLRSVIAQPQAAISG